MSSKGFALTLRDVARKKLISWSGGFLFISTVFFCRYRVECYGGLYLPLKISLCEKFCSKTFYKSHFSQKTNTTYNW